MKVLNNSFSLTCLSILLASSAATAQEINKFTFNAGLGFVQPVGGSGDRLDTGWNLNLGAGYKVVPRVGVVLGFDYTHMGIGSNTLTSVGFPGGNVHIWDFTLNPIVHVMPHGPVDAYVTGGPGIYHRTQEFTAPTTSTFTAFDPFFGFYQVGVPTTQILDSYSVVKPGLNVGGGLAFGTRWNAKFYVEARYHKIFLGNDRHTDYIPVTFGVRW